MLNFFRKLRQNLLSGAKTVTYFKYATGEIFLVMIGILLALQVNNWNDKRKKNEEETQYYFKLLEDFELEKKQIESIQNSIELSIKNINELMLDFDAGNRTRNYLVNKFVSSVRRDIYVPLNKTFEELIYSGNLNIIGDQRIKNALIQYDSDMKSNIAVIQKNRDEFVKEVFEFTNSSLDFGMQEIDFVNELLFPEVIGTLPKDDWTKDKNSEIYKNLQKVSLYNLATAGREKQILNIVLKLMETPKKLLEEKCQNLKEK